MMNMLFTRKIQFVLIYWIKKTLLNKYGYSIRYTSRCFEAFCRKIDIHKKFLVRNCGMPKKYIY